MPHTSLTLHERLDCRSSQFIHSLNSVVLSSVHRHNRCEVLTSAVQFYPAMLEAIAKAQHSINMECYIFRPDATGRTFMDAMIERARAGVVVTLVLDAVGSFRFGFSAIREMRQAGCRVELYQRLRWFRLSRLNNRTHRELLVIDGSSLSPGSSSASSRLS